MENEIPDGQKEIDALARRHQQLLEKLKAAPVVEVAGVVHASGACGVGGRTGAGENWEFRFSLEPWKITGGPIDQSELVVRKPTSKAELNALMGQINAYQVVRVRARLLQGTQGERSEALLVALPSDECRDAELVECAREMQKPVVRREEFFGEFTLNRRIGTFETKTFWGPMEVRLTLSIDDGKLETVARLAQSLWESQEGWDRRVRECARDELLKLKNDSWLSDGENAVSAPEFVRRMTLESIDVDLSGTVDFWFGDDDMFWGHMIRVSGTLSVGPKWAGLEG